jgi:nicotinamidase-related amidase
MTLDEIEIKKTAILFFDLLKGYADAPEGDIKAKKELMVTNATRLMKAGREARIPIFFAKGNHRADQATSALILTDTNNSLKPWPGGKVTKSKMHVIGGDQSSEVIPELDPQPDDYYIPKYRWSAFYQTSLDLSLRARGIHTVIISGGSTDVGVASTVFSGRDMDYNIILVSDACATSHDQRAHDTLMELIFPRMSRVRTTDQVLRMIQDARGK